jgi:hypothetical protein
MGFCFPDALDGIEMVGAHLHFLGDDRTRGGHVLSYTLLDGVARLDGATALHVELPGRVAAPRHGDSLDQAAVHRLESIGERSCGLPGALEHAARMTRGESPRTPKPTSSERSPRREV